MKSYVKLWSVPVLFCFERKTRNLTPRNLILLSRVVWCGSTKQLESFLWDKSLLQSEGFNFSMAAHLLTQITAAVAPKLNGLGLPPYVQTKTHPSQRTQPTHFLSAANHDIILSKVRAQQTPLRCYLIPFHVYSASLQTSSICPCQSGNHNKTISPHIQNREVLRIYLHIFNVP